MTPHQCAIDITNAYDSRSREDMARAIARLVAMVSLGPVIERMTPAQLEVRRAELKSQLERVEKRIVRDEDLKREVLWAEQEAAIRADATRKPNDPSS